MKRLFQRVLSKLRHNSPRVLYNKWKIVRCVEQMEPMPVGESETEMHVLVSARDFLSLLWSLRSFYDVSSVQPSLYVHADPSLKEEQISILKRCFPGVHLVSNTEADSVMKAKLVDFPICAAMRERHVLYRKVFDFFCFGDAPRILLGDSDILYFEDPVEITARTDGMNAFIEDHWTNYILPVEELHERTGLDVPERINIGFGMIDRSAFDLSFIEKLYTDIPELTTASFLFAQTTVMLMACRRGVLPVGNRYRMISYRKMEESVLKHYTRAIREQLYLEGIPALHKMYNSRVTSK